MFIVAEISQAREARNRVDQILPSDRRPCYLHTHEDDALTELLRLKKLIPYGDFVLFESTTTAIPTMEDGTVFRTEKLAP